MSVRRYAVFLALVILALPVFSSAQKADAAFVIGGSFVSDSDVTISVICPPGPPCPVPVPGTIKSDNHVFLEGNLGVRILDAKAVSLHLEFPLAGIPSQQLHFSNLPTSTADYSSLFFTPSLRVKLLPVSPIAPFVSVGGGLARYSFTNGSSTKGALQYGGGLDLKTGIPHLGFRAEVRDFVSTEPNFGQSGILSSVNSQSGLHHHNLLLGGGIVLNF